MNREVKFRIKYTNGKDWIFKVFTFHEVMNGDPFEVLNNSPLLRSYKMVDEPDRFTGLHDKNGVEIYEGDIMSDWNEIDGEMIQSKMQVYWCEKSGAWKLDNSYNQDKSSGDLLSDELIGFAYEVSSNVCSKNIENE